MSTTKNSRSGNRKSAPKVEVVTIFPGRDDLSPDKALAAVAQASPVHSLFTVVAVVRDASETGLGLKFEGQQIMARNVLRPDERYLLKLTLPRTDVGPDEAAAPFLLKERDSNYFSLVVRARCRWYKPGQISKVGFVISEGNDPGALAFLKQHFGVAGE